MNTNVPVTQSFVTTLFREILLPLFPRALHEEIERELPTLGLLDARAAAVCRPGASEVEHGCQQES